MTNIRTITSVSISLAACLWLQSCTQPPANTTQSPTPSANKLTFSGSSTLGNIVSEIEKPYQVERAEVQIDVQNTNSWRGIADVRQGTADIGMVNRALKSDEQDLLAFTIAKDGLTVILHRNNPVKSLTEQQIVDIYSDKINNWKQVGGKDAPITVISRIESGAALGFFTDYFKMEPSGIRADVIVANSEESIQAVAGNPNAIGYASVSDAEVAATSGAAVQLLPINGVAASVANVSNSTFPISRPLNLVTKNPPSELAKNFIDFARSPQGQGIVKEKKFVPALP